MVKMKSLVRAGWHTSFFSELVFFHLLFFPWRKSFHLEHQFPLKTKDKHLPSPQESGKDSVVSL